MSSVKVEEHLFKHNFCLSRKNKITAFHNRDHVIEIQKAASSITLETNLQFDKFNWPESRGFENLLFAFFKISYFLGMTPFYWRKVRLENGTVTVERSFSKIHTVIVIIVHICAALCFMKRFYLLSYDLKNPINYFIIARTILSTSLCSFFVWSLWTRHSICKQMLVCMLNLSIFPNTSKLREKSVYYPVLFSTIGLLCLTSVHRGVNEFYSRWEEICSGEEQGLRKSLCCDENYHTWKTILKYLFIIINYFGRTMRRLPRGALLATALTVWQMCKSFANFIKQRNLQSGSYQNHEIMTVLLAYEKLKCISNLISDLVGEMLICEIVEDIVYFSLEVQLRLRRSNWFNIFVVFETWLVAFLAYYIAACAAGHTVQEFSHWLARDDVISKLSPGKLSTLQTQLAANPIGMKGGSLFTLTKNLLANVVTVWVTYFIILLQFQSALLATDPAE